ncbi:MAG: competence protein ComE [Patescibacteria group bacterium]
MSVLATCDRLRTASSAEKDKRLRGFGYNGSVSGDGHCDDVGHLMVDGHCERTLHGEENLRENTRREDLIGSRVRIVATPCIRCVKPLVNVPVGEIEYEGEYQNARGSEFIEKIAARRKVKIVRREIDWPALFQEIFDLLCRPGGVFSKKGYRLHIVKEPVGENVKPRRRE